MADVLAAHAGRISRADQRADRGAGYGRGPHPHLVERLDHRDMGEAARAAAAERKREGLHDAGLAREFPALGRERPHQCGLGGSKGAGGGAVAHAAGDALHDRGEAEEIIGEIDRQMRPRIEPGARHIGIHVSRQRGNAERCEIEADQRAGAGFRMRHVPLHQVIGKIRQRIAERRQFPIEHRGDPRRSGAMIMLSSR